MLLLLCVAQAKPATLTLRYEMTLNGAPIGHRDVTVTSMGPDLRMIEVWTEGDLPLDVHFEQKLTGLAGTDPQPFAAVNEERGMPSEVQLARSPEGWVVSVVEPTRVGSSNLAWADLDETSLSLIDPGGVRLRDGQTLDVLSAETGEMLSGPVRDAGPVTVEVGGVSLPGQAWVWTVEGAELELVYGDDGTPLRYRSVLLGQPVELVLQAAPDWGEALDAPLIAPKVTEEEL
jgi:hypothetical protein